MFITFNSLLTSTAHDFVAKLTLLPDPRDSYIQPLYMRSSLSE